MSAKKMKTQPYGPRNGFCPTLDHCTI